MTLARRVIPSGLFRRLDPFETAIGTILGQVISVTRASRLMGQLVATYGEEIVHPVSGEPVRVFPTPRTLAEANLKGLGVTRQKRAAIREFSSRVAEGSIQLEPAQNLDDFKCAVQTVKGIGAWSAEYMALRALGDTDAFPATDLVLQRFVQAKLNFDPDAARPWRGYLAVYLWNEYRHGSHQERKTRHAGLHTHDLSNWQTQAGGRRSRSHRGALAQ